MTNVPDDSYSQDGNMSVLLNMRHKGGELVQCQPPTPKVLDYEVEQVLYHAQSGLWLELVAGIIQTRDKDDHTKPLTDNSKKVLSFAIMGNIVIMYYKNSVEYAIWEGKSYRYLGELPDISNALSVEIDGQEYETTQTGTVSGSNGNAIETLIIGLVNKNLDIIYNKGGFVDRAWFKLGLRLFDGTYIRTSNIVQASWFKDGGEDGSPGTSNFYFRDYDLNSTYRSTVKYFMLQTKIKDELFEKLKGWENVIVGVDIFTTGSLMSFGMKKAFLTHNLISGGAFYETYMQFDADEFRENIINAKFYKMAEYSVKGEKVSSIDNTSPSRLSVQTVLTEIGQELYLAKNNFVNNGLYHIYNYNKRLFSGYGFTKSIFKVPESSSNQAPGEYTMVVFLKTDTGEKVVSKTFEVGNNYTSLEYYSYPDSRAYKMLIIANGTCKEIQLTPHPFRNEAFAFQLVNKGYDVNAGMLIDYPYFAFPGEEVDVPEYEVDDIETVDNVLKVSTVDNPLYFPTARTYKFEGSIKGVATNAEAISTGQFGQYPLFVFTTEGIWAMQVDASGQGAYVSQSPFSREVCSGAVCPVSGGIVFTTARGVMVISGGQVMELSAPLDGLENLMLQGNLMTAIFGKAGKGLIPPVQIREYLKPVEGYETKLAYNYLHNEVILSNAKRGYSYVYSLTNQEWSIIDNVFDVITNSYPELVVYNNIEKKIYEFAEGNDPVPIVAITRPVKVDTLDFKRLRQAALRCTFEGSLNFYVLGSNDGASFVCITGKECPTKSEVESGITSVSTQRDLITSMSRSKQYKYIAIAVAGNMRGRISLAEMLVEGGFASNQLR